jgi:sortase A
VGTPTLSPFLPVRAGSALKVVRRSFAPLLLFSGVALLGYAGFQYGAMLLEQRHLQALWRDQQKSRSAVNRRSSVSLAESGLTRITIPSIDFSAVIVEGTDLYAMMIGPGHLVGTAEPGEPGNSVVSAHRDTFFRNIMKLSQGDSIFVERNGQTYNYIVEGMRIVKPTDISVIAPTSDNRLTLITCDPAYYPGPAPQRLVVVGKLAAAPAVPPSALGTQSASAKRAAIKKASAHGAAR